MAPQSPRNFPPNKSNQYKQDAAKTNKIRPSQEISSQPCPNIDSEKRANSEEFTTHKKHYHTDQDRYRITGFVHFKNNHSITANRSSNSNSDNNHLPSIMPIERSHWCHIHEEWKTTCESRNKKIINRLQWLDQSRPSPNLTSDTTKQPVWYMP